MGGRNFLPPGTALPGPVLALVLVICLVIYLAMPLALLLFYRSDGVRLTFEARDPSVPWTDRVPPAVLFLVLAEALMSVTLLSGVPTLHGMPLFGQILEGPAAKAWALGTGLLCGWSSVGLYKLDIRAWYAAMALMALGGVGALLNHVLLDQEAMLRAVGMTAEQIAQMAAARPSKADMIFSTVTSFGGFVALLAYVRRYFTRV